MTKYKCTKCHRDATVEERDCVCGGFIAMVPRRYRHRCPGCGRRHTCAVSNPMWYSEGRYDPENTFHRVWCSYSPPNGQWFEIGTTTSIFGRRSPR